MFKEAEQEMKLNIAQTETISLPTGFVYFIFFWEIVHSFHFPSLYRDRIFKLFSIAIIKG